VTAERPREEVERARAPGTFRALVELCRSRGAGRRPVTFAAVARRCRTSRKHLWSLMLGQKVAQRHTVERLAAGLRVPSAVVEAALARSRELAP